MKSKTIPGVQPKDTSSTKPQKPLKPSGVPVMPIVTPGVAKLKPVIPEKKSGNFPPKPALKPPSVALKPVNRPKQNGIIIKELGSDKPADSVEKENVPEKNSSVSAIKEKFNRQSATGAEPAKLKPVAPKKPNIQQASKTEVADDTIHYSPAGKKYKMLKFPENSDDPPTKPSLPNHVDLYEFLGNHTSIFCFISLKNYFCE